jgi:hypothetical protein
MRIGSVVHRVSFCTVVTYDALIFWIACKGKPVNPAVQAHSGTKLAAQGSVFET